MLTATTLTMTCGACPSQWEGDFLDGRTFYIRYRWGGLSVRISDNVSDNYDDAVGGKEILYLKHGDDMHGVLSSKEMQELTKHIINWSQIKLPPEETFEW